MTTPRWAPDAQPSFWLLAHQARFAGRVDGVEVWEYLAWMGVSRDGGTGRLLAQVHTPRNNLPAEPCEAAKTLWGGYAEDGLVDLGWRCQVTNVGGRQVGVVSGHNGDHAFDQWAVHRHDDGTVVFIAQARHFADSGTEEGPLTEQPLTLQRLAELAANPKFKVE